MGETRPPRVGDLWRPDPRTLYQWNGTAWVRVQAPSTR